MGAWSLVFALPSFVLALATRCVEYACRSVVFLTVFGGICYHMGWFHRLIWFMAEREARKILNDTPVTIGSFDLDLIRGSGWLSNVVIHSPKRDLWKWESPLLARIGKIHVETNLVRVLLSMALLREEPPLEIYTLRMSDIQVFVERKHQVFNIYLLDPHNVIPDPQFDEEETSENKVISGTGDNSNATKNNGGGLAKSTTDDSSRQEEMSEASSTPAEEETAKQLVDEMIKAVQSLGKAARDGSLPEALQQQRQSVATKLKELQKGKPIKSLAVKDGIRIVQHVSKAVVEKTQKIVQQPDKRQLENEKVVYARFGRVIMEDLRVFTRWNVTNGVSTASATDKTSSSEASQAEADSALFNSWNKPIVVDRLAVRPSEFCAPLAVTDDDGLPPLYRPINYCMDAILKSVVAEMAKSNTGRLLIEAESLFYED